MSEFCQLWADLKFNYNSKTAKNAYTLMDSAANIILLLDQLERLSVIVTVQVRKYRTVLFNLRGKEVRKEARVRQIINCQR